VRAFPIQAPTRGISLVRDGGKEVAWIDDLEHRARSPRPGDRRTRRARIHARDPVIKGVSSFATPCTWT
jgi:hypothetical protein